MNNLDKNSTILVTGSGGVLGSAILSELNRSGFHNILSPDRSELNLLDANSTRSYIRKYKPKSIIHLASLVYGLGGNLKYQLQSVIANTAINNNLFSAISEVETEHFFFAGTVASYPFPYSAIPIVEESFFNGLPHDGEFGYAMAKRHAYTYLKIMSKKNGIRFVYGIFTNLYGPRDKFDVENGHVIPSLIAKGYDAGTKKESLTVWGDGSAIRDFLYASDAASAAVLCMKNPSNDIINISSGCGVPISAIAELICSYYGVDKINYLTDRPVGIPSRIVDNSRLKKLGFSVSISIEEGIRQTCDWYEKNINGIRQ